jgi:hypothetical protein
MISFPPLVGKLLSETPSLFSYNPYEVLTYILTVNGNQFEWHKGAPVHAYQLTPDSAEYSALIQSVLNSNNVLETFKKLNTDDQKSILSIFFTPTHYFETISKDSLILTAPKDIKAEWLSALAATLLYLVHLNSPISSDKTSVANHKRKQQRELQELIRQLNYQYRFATAWTTILDHPEVLHSCYANVSVNTMPKARSEYLLSLKTKVLACNKPTQNTLLPLAYCDYYNIAVFGLTPKAVKNLTVLHAHYKV